jgi:hypothetical protein
MQNSKGVRAMLMNHIPEERMVELSQSTGHDFSADEKAHLAKCEDCMQRLGALFRLQRTDYAESR